jgi:hypothetical protein
VVAAGGDGTLNAVARATLGTGCPYGVIPQGTFNYFARTHGIPTDTAEAARALLAAEVVPVPVGSVNDRIFLVNASLGLYPEALDLREEQEERHGRSRPVALWATVLTVLRGHRPMRIRMESEGGLVERSTLTLFVGLNRLQLEQMGWDGAEVEEGRLAAIVLEPVSTARRASWRRLSSFALRRSLCWPSSRVRAATQGHGSAPAAPSRRNTRSRKEVRDRARRAGQSCGISPPAQAMNIHRPLSLSSTSVYWPVTVLRSFL